jgi:hypothetical protein
MILALFVDQTFAVFLTRMEADDLAVLAEMMA